MNTPASYRGTARIPSISVRALAKRLDPQRWAVLFPYIWSESYFADETRLSNFVRPTKAPSRSKKTAASKAAAKKSLAKTVAAKRGPRAIPRSEDPPRMGATTAGPPGGNGNGPILLKPPKGDQHFFEDVLFGGFRYRNVLKVNYSVTRELASFKYEQFACLTTKQDTHIDGGIDVDSGEVTVSSNKGGVTVTISKHARFTQPADLKSDLSDAAHVFVPMTLDSLLHSLVFSA
jgi:hypothetical protein